MFSKMLDIMYRFYKKKVEKVSKNVQSFLWDILEDLLKLDAPKERSRFNEFRGVFELNLTIIII